MSTAGSSTNAAREWARGPIKESTQVVFSGVESSGYGRGRSIRLNPRGGGQRRSSQIWGSFVNRSLRLLMGIATLAIVAPSLLLVLPEGVSELIPWLSPDPGEVSSPRSAEEGERLQPLAVEGPASQKPPDSNSAHSHDIASVPGNQVPLVPPTFQTDTTQTIHTTIDTSPNSTDATSSEATSTTRADAPDSDDAPDDKTSGTITGEACPCTVTGTAELEGNISLQGDLTVMGGTLIARPGVNVSGNGYQIMFMNGGKADFQGTPTSTWSGDGSSANLTRDVNFSNLRRIMFHEGAGKSTLRYFAVTDSGTGQLGDYSIHFHLNGNSTRGTLVEGVVVLNSRHHAFVPHGSHGITFRDTIAKNGKCEAYWWDQPEFQSTSQVNNSNDILYDHVLADGVTNCAGDSRGFRLSGIELGAGQGNVIRNSVVRNVKPSHAKDCSGYHWPELSDKQPSSWTFSNNASYGSACNGIFVWQNDNEEHIVNGFAGDGIDHGAYTNRYDYRNVDVDFIQIHAVGWSVTGGSADVVTAFKHNLDGGPVNLKSVSIGRFIVDNASNGGSTPATYNLDNVGLACGDIEWKSAVPGTKVVVDGKECG